MIQPMQSTSIYSKMSSLIASASCNDLKRKFTPVFYGICLAAACYGAFVLCKRAITWIQRPSATVQKTQEVTESALTPLKSPSSMPLSQQVATLPKPLPAPPKPMWEPKWTTDEAVHCSDPHEYGVFSRYQATVMAALPAGEFKDALQGLAMTQISIHNLTHPHIYRPNESALQQIACNYHAKYGILIYEIRLNESFSRRGCDLNKLTELTELIGRIEEEVEGPQYIGIEVSLGEYGHALPLIFFIGKHPSTHARVRQFLIADTVPDSSFVREVERQLPPAKTYQSTRGRQIDQFSCRIGAMQFLKRALLALHDYQGDNGLIGYLKMHGIMWDYDEFRIEHLPPEFDAAEQITNKGGSLDKANSRDKRSKNLDKRTRSVQELRKAHTEPVDFSYDVYIDDEKLKKLIASKQLPANVTHAPGVLHITCTKEVNTHLARKGQQLSMGQKRLPLTRQG